jgi:hypothetical protein
MYIGAFMPVMQTMFQTELLATLPKDNSTSDYVLYMQKPANQFRLENRQNIPHSLPLGLQERREIVARGGGRRKPPLAPSAN